MVEQYLYMLLFVNVGCLAATVGISLIIGNENSSYKKLSTFNNILLGKYFALFVPVILLYYGLKGRKPNYYDILEIPTDATKSQIHQAFRNATLKYHPVIENFN